MFPCERRSTSVLFAVNRKNPQSHAVYADPVLRSDIMAAGKIWTEDFIINNLLTGKAIEIYRHSKLVLVRERGNNHL